jgi:hypothetical protein
MGCNDMVKMIAVTALLIAIHGSVLAADKVHPPARVPQTILMDRDALSQSKQRILGGNEALTPAYRALIKKAEKAMKSGPFSVTDKSQLPPSGDQHDYVSYGRYWWPDPTKPDGLPYIRRDGKTNPKSQTPSESDRGRMDDMAAGVESLALAYYFTGEERYANKAAQLLRTWFLNPETRMNPSLNYAQTVPGMATGRSWGIIDSRVLCRALDGAILLENSLAWSIDDMVALRTWSSDYLDWLKTDELALTESKAQNNHGTFYDIQAIYFALFSGDDPFARLIAKQALEARVLAQIESDGSQPEELARTRAFHYSVFNLKAMFGIAHMAQHLDVDLWHAGDSRIKKAVDYLAPYADPGREWPFPAVKEVRRADLHPLLLHASAIYKDESYLQRARQIPEADREIGLENLTYPMMP